jgi:hypothetical protein
MLRRVKMTAETGRSAVVDGEEDSGSVNWWRWRVLSWLRLLCQHGQADKPQDDKAGLRVKNGVHGSPERASDGEVLMAALRSAARKTTACRVTRMALDDAGGLSVRARTWRSYGRELENNGTTVTTNSVGGGRSSMVGQRGKKERRQ